MIIPSIDLQDGNAVQLIGGEEKALDAGDPRPLATRYGRVGEIAVMMRPLVKVIIDRPSMT